jgi:hypothetical protein
MAAMVIEIGAALVASVMVWAPVRNVASSIAVQLLPPSAVQWTTTALEDPLPPRLATAT